MADSAPKLVDMALTKAEMKAERKEMMSGGDNPYPWGLSISLDGDALKKLGITDLPQVGAEYHLLAITKVTSVNSQVGSNDADDRRVGLQICELGILLSESAEEEKAEGKDTPKTEAAESKKALSTLKKY